MSSRWAMIAKGCTKDENVTFSDLRPPRLHTASRCGSMICQRMLFFYLLLSLVKPWRIFLSCLLWVSSSISPSSRNAIILSRSQGSSTPVVTFHYDMLFVLLLHNRRGHAYIMSAKYLDFQLTTFMHCLFINLGPFISSPPPSVLTWYLYGTLGR